MFRFGDQKSRASHDTGMPLAKILHVLDASLNTDLGGHGVDSRRIERGSKADGLGVLGLHRR